MKELTKWLETNKITEIECITPDQTGIARGKIMPTDKFIAEKGIRLPESVLMQTTTGDYPDNEIYYRLLDPQDIDMELRPDEKAAFTVPWAQEPSAQIIHDCYDSMGNLMPLSSRAVLKNVLKLYEDKGWLAIVAPEVEFYLTKRCTDPDIPLEPPIGRSGRQESGRQSFSIDAANEFDPIIEDIYDWCEDMHLDIDTLIHEEGAAQLEFNFRHGEALRLADQVFIFKRTVREAALKHGIGATFMAKPISGEPGSSMHIHQSLTDAKSGANLFSNKDGSASNLFYNYIGGLQTYIPQMMPIFAPNVNSYRRYLPGANGNAPVNIEWGEDNRTVGLRVPKASPAARRVENRLPGADTNPYLTLAGNLLCGYLGMTQDLKPRKPVQYRMGGEADETVPWNLEAALDEMASSEVIRDALGTKFVDGFVATRWAEYEGFKRVISSWERQYLLATV
ncbi:MULTISPECIES: glutamine synthetase family protein [Reinekea]|jgi:glutamine synthetase|uniref:Glutamine synthetase family protein, putative glutamate-putrescine ligase n=1 Tax=Reinekea forsetii TaxID=1336806 RepID=A0A2K8KLJ9_9GAMM|nr:MULTISPECIES: glutamine synthetase family protein [Reinekea]ATX75773.1 glutamine synthetase family protein, putative glutamate-putrescine ligase [Reinekea forsetii]